MPRVIRANSFEIASPTFPSSPVFDSEVKFTKTLPKLNPSKSINVETSKFHDVLADNSALESVLPKIN